MQQKNQFAHLIDLEEDMDSIDDDIGNELLGSPEEESGMLSMLSNAWASMWQNLSLEFPTKSRLKPVSSATVTRYKIEKLIVAS